MADMQFAMSFEENFDGRTYERERDHSRLAAQLGAVKTLMADGEWRTLGGIAAAVDAPQASVSARLRDLRKPKFGGWIVEREYLHNGIWKYRLRSAA